MRSSVRFSFLLFALALGFPGATIADDPLPAGYDGLVKMVTAARSRSVSAADKSRVLQIAIGEYKKLLQARTHLDEAALLKKFQADAAFRESLLLPTNPYRALYSEINFLASTLISDGVFDRCNSQFDPKHLQEKAITRNILDQRSKYEASCEGAGYSGFIDVLGRKNGGAPGKKGTYAAYPLLFAGKNAADLLKLSDMITLESSLREKVSVLGRDFPAYREPANREDYLELKRTEELKGEIYDHAVVNSLKTKAAIDYFFGGKSISEIKAELVSRIGTSCESCTPARRESLIHRALNGVLSEQKEDPTGHPRIADPRNVAVRLCNRLIDAGYYDYYAKNVDRKFENGKFVVGKTKRDRLREVIPGEVVVTVSKKTGKSSVTVVPEKVEALSKEVPRLPDPIARDNLIPSRPFDARFVPRPSPAPRPSIDLSGSGEAMKYADRRDPNVVPGTGAAMDAAYDYHRYLKRRMEIYQSIVREGSTNLLFLTDALSAREESPEGTEYSPRLDCTPSGIEADAALVQRALEEAKWKADVVLSDLNATIQPADANDPNAAKRNRSAIEAMIRKNPTAVGQAVAERPDLAGLVCDGLNHNLLADEKDATLHQAFTWGVMIVGTALTFTGVGSGVGVEMLLAGGMAASSATLTIDQQIRSDDARELAALYRTQYRGGQSGNDFLLDQSEEKVREYQNLKVGVMDVFGVGVDAMGFVGSALKASITLQSLDRMLAAARESKGFREFAKDKDPLEALVEYSRRNEEALAKNSELLAPASTNAPLVPKTAAFAHMPDTPRIFESASEHVSNTSFYAPAIKNEGKNYAMANGKTLDTQRKIQLETTGLGTETPVSVGISQFKDGNWVNVGEAKRTVDGVDIPFVSYDKRPEYRFDFVYADGKKVAKTTQELIDDVPPGTRFKLNPQNKQFRNSGFAGGHTESAWNETLKTYGDKIKIVAGGTVSRFIKVPGSDKTYFFQSIQYEFDGVRIVAPKTIMRGNSGDVLEFQKAVDPMVRRAMKSAKASEYEIRVPVEGGELVIIRYPATPGTKNAGEMYSWYVDFKQKTAPKLLPSSSTSHSR